MNECERAIDQSDHDVIREAEARLHPHDLTEQIVVRAQLQLDLSKDRREAVLSRSLRIVTCPPVVRKLEFSHAPIVPPWPDPTTSRRGDSRPGRG